MKNTDAYRALCAKAAEIGWPAHYQDDLYYHDHERLCGGDPEDAIDEGVQFAWLVRPTGTWVITHHLDDILLYVLRYEREHRAFWWDGDSLAEIPLSHVQITLWQATQVDRVYSAA